MTGTSPQPQSARVLPGPRSPRPLQLARWVRQPFAFMERYGGNEGQAFRTRIASGKEPMVFVSSPEALKILLSGDQGSPFDSPGTINSHLFEPLLGSQSLFALGGEPHRRMRKLLMPPFHGERMRAYAAVIEASTDSVLEQACQQPRFELQQAMQALSMQVILQAVFGLRQGPRMRELQHRLGHLLNSASRPLEVLALYVPGLRLNLGPRSPWGSFLAQRRAVDALLLEELHAQRERPDPSRTDILSLLLAARDEEGQPLSDQELRDELMTLLVAGHETTAHALSWALYWIHRQPEVLQRLRQEIDANATGSSPVPSSQLPYLGAVCNEALRIYPVGMLTFPRVVRQNVELDGYRLGPGTIVIGSIYLAHRSRLTWGDPETFRPERFLERAFSPFEFLPFGGGSRRCIGMAFAQFEMQLVLQRLIAGHELTLLDRRDLTPVRRGLVSAAPPITARLRRRS